MTFLKSAWAIDGPVTGSSLARALAYAATSGDEGIVQKSDLKVSTLETPGNGIRISPGAGIVLNRYKGVGTDETYTVTNPETHTISSEDMPAATVGATTYVVCVSVGDPEFSQAGHPWMTSSPIADPSDFTYVRPIVVTAAAWNSRTWPAIALAVLTRPGSTTTITSGMLEDVRKLARPRTLLAQGHVAAPGGNPLNAETPTTERWPSVAIVSVTIPTWAVRAKIHGFIEGARFTKTGVGTLWAYVEGTALKTAATNIDETVGGTVDLRRQYNVGGEIDVTSIAGQTKNFSILGTVLDTPSKNFLQTDSKTSAFLSIFFEEQPI